MEELRKKKDLTYAEAFGLVWDVLVTMIVVTLVFAFGGRWLDGYFHTAWVFTVIGFILLVLVGYQLIRKKGEKITKRMDESGK